MAKADRSSPWGPPGTRVFALGGATDFSFPHIPSGARTGAMAGGKPTCCRWAGRRRANGWKHPRPFMAGFGPWKRPDQAG
jgi:hypothetical protein